MKGIIYFYIKKLVPLNILMNFNFINLKYKLRLKENLEYNI
jgi:hypothetical protein